MAGVALVVVEVTFDQGNFFETDVNLLVEVMRCCFRIMGNVNPDEMVPAWDTTCAENRERDVSGEVGDAVKERCVVFFPLLQV